MPRESAGLIGFHPSLVDQRITGTSFDAPGHSCGPSRRATYNSLSRFRSAGWTVRPGPGSWRDGRPATARRPCPTALGESEQSAADIIHLRVHAGQDGVDATFDSPVGAGRKSQASRRSWQASHFASIALERFLVGDFRRAAISGPTGGQVCRGGKLLASGCMEGVISPLMTMLAHFLEGINGFKGMVQSIRARLGGAPGVIRFDERRSTFSSATKYPPGRSSPHGGSGAIIGQRNGH